MFAIGLLLLVLGLAMVAGAFGLPDEAFPGLFIGGISVFASGALLAYLDWPERRKRPVEGTVEADAYLVDARLVEGEAVGYRMVELVLDVRPKDGVPFQVKRKFIANKGPLENGQRLRVRYNPIDPDQIELV